MVYTLLSLSSLSCRLLFVDTTLVDSLITVDASSSELSTSIQGKSDEKKVRQLVSTIVATMSDQGATNPVFNRQLLEYKQSIMPYVVENWDTIDQSLKSEMCNISSFFCKMHIFVNMASEVDKCLAVLYHHRISGHLVRPE